MPAVEKASRTRGPYEEILVATADGIRAAGEFDAPERWRFDCNQVYTREEWLDQVPTFGGISRLAPAQLDDLLAGIAAAIDMLGGSFTMRYAARRRHRHEAGQRARP